MEGTYENPAPTTVAGYTVHCVDGIGENVAKTTGEKVYGVEDSNALLDLVAFVPTRKCERRRLSMIKVFAKDMEGKYQGWVRLNVPDGDEKYAARKEASFKGTNKSTDYDNDTPVLCESTTHDADSPCK